jgi:hypothetical protein
VTPENTGLTRQKDFSDRVVSAALRAGLTTELAVPTGSARPFDRKRNQLERRHILRHAAIHCGYDLNVGYIERR